MSIDEQHAALPKLYGAPAYARPPSTAQSGAKPFDPDELPLEALRTDEDRELEEHLRSQAASATSDEIGGKASRGRSFGLRGITGRLLGGS